MIVRQINQNIYYFKFGLKSLMLLPRFLTIDDKAKRLIFQSILLDGAVVQLPPEVDSIIIQTFKDAFEDSKVLSISSLEDILNFISQYDLTEEINSWYKKAVGQVGISPAAFYSMTPFEIQLAYLGYIKRQELQANCSLIALRKARDNQAELFSLLGGQGCRESSMSARKNTFQVLGI